MVALEKVTDRQRHYSGQRDQHIPLHRATSKLPVRHRILLHARYVFKSLSTCCPS